MVIIVYLKFGKHIKIFGRHLLLGEHFARYFF